MIEFPERVSLARLPTPLQYLPRSSELLGVQLWVKRDDLTGITLSGNKVRKLEFTLARALAEDCDSIITCGGLQSNHCRATAFACAQLGLQASLVLRGQPAGLADGNLLLDHLAGAEVETHPASIYTQQLPQLLQARAEQLRAAGRRPYIIPTGASDGTGIWGYIAAAKELQADCAAEGVEPAWVVCATGSGGTQAGLTLGLHLLGSPARVLGVAVCDDEAYFQRKVRADIEQWQRRYQRRVALDNLDVCVNADYIGPGYARAEAAVFEAITELARREGILLDPVYTGKAFYGLTREIQCGRIPKGANVVFVHTGGIFGNFSYKQHFKDCF